MILLKQVKVIDTNSSYHNKTVDVLIQRGKIAKIAKRITEKKADIWAFDGAHLSPGFADIGTQIGDPGFEHKEDLQTAANAAAAGGFTALACTPNTHPVIDSKSEVLYVKNHFANSLVDFHPIGAVSKSCEGKEITEMYDMRKAGAVAFSDGQHPIEHSGMMMRSLLYVKPFNGVIINQPLDHDTALGGEMHEGAVSTSLGMKGIPALAEELMLQRDLYLLEYTDSRLHVANISSANSVVLLREAKKRGLKVTASVNPMNFVFDDTALTDFDTNLKVMPPIREKSDIKAIKRGLKDGTIDCICTHHIPEDEEGKKLEFVYARPGVIGLETTFSACCTYLDLDLSAIIDMLAVRPRQILGLEVPSIAEGKPACLCLYDPAKEWVFTEKNIQSKSKNTPFIDKEFKGRVLATLNNGEIWKND